MEKVLIITGGNKGIGKGIVETYQQQGYKIFSIARTRNKLYSEDVEQVKVDLTKGKNAETVLPLIFKSVEAKNIKTVTLINNAGTLGNVNAIENIESIAIQKTIKLNLITPFLLTASFIRLTQQLGCTKNVINISSGAANKPLYGWAVYSSTKAALDMMTKAIALEQSYQENGVKIISIHPGVVDTDMQAAIRSTQETKFKDVKRFIDMKNENKLADPKDVGLKIYNVDVDSSVENGAIINLRDSLAVR